jgi:hypothetical protein
LGGLGVFAGASVMAGALGRTSGVALVRALDGTADGSADALGSGDAGDETVVHPTSTKRVAKAARLTCRRVNMCARP